MQTKLKMAISWEQVQLEPGHADHDWMARALLQAGVHICTYAWLTVVGYLSKGHTALHSSRIYVYTIVTNQSMIVLARAIVL